MTGDGGYIKFWPLLRESCGTMVSQEVTCSSGAESGCPDVGKEKIDRNACAKTPLLYNGGRANGITIFCHTKGKNKGKGCDKPKLPPGLPPKKNP